MTTGQQAAEPLPGHSCGVYAVATAVLDGRPIVVAGGEEETVRVWDLTTGRQVGLLAGHTGTVEAVATTVLDGRPVAVTGSGDETVRVWDLATCRQIGEPLTGHTDSVVTVATALWDGRPVAVTGSHDRTMRVWDLTTGQQVGSELAFPVLPVNAVAVTSHGDLLVGYGFEVALLTRPSRQR